MGSMDNTSSSAPTLPPASAILHTHTSTLPRPSHWSVRAVLSHPQSPLPNFPEQSSSPIAFFHYLNRLKVEKREGWRRFGIAHGESIADHMYRMSLITILAPTELSQRLDIPRCTKMALIHDMAEGLVGDLTPVDGVPKAEKSRREAETMDWVATSLLGEVNKGLSGKEIRDCWQEYEDGETLESRFVHDVDKIELLLQMVEYERASECRLDLSEFSWVSKRVGLAEMKAWADEILEERRTLWEKAGREPREPSEKAVIRQGQEEYYGKGEDGSNGIALTDVNGDAN